MPNIFIISDPHLNHASMLKFTKSNGELLRPGFDSVEHMDATIIDNWNRTVSPQDTVYLLGDVAMKRAAVPLAARLNGQKCLVLGNHDRFELDLYARYFREIRAMHFWNANKLMLTHVPMHIQSIKPGYLNVHGHTHAHVINSDLTMRDTNQARQHSSYFNACMELHDYTPVALDTILSYRKDADRDICN